MDQTYMKEQPVLKLIVSMALPMVISMMVSSLYNIVDSFFIARISEDAMTALSLVYPVQNLINAVMIGFGIGINAVISFYLGAQDKKMADRAATQGMLLQAAVRVRLRQAAIRVRLRQQAASLRRTAIQAATWVAIAAIQPELPPCLQEHTKI